MARDIINFEADAEIRAKLAYLMAVTGIGNMSGVIRMLINREYISMCSDFRHPAPPCPEQEPAVTNHR